ncbi:hypothetical protein VTN96DRAFT_7951 [Rasamsonia emersonii]
MSSESGLRLNFLRNSATFLSSQSPSTAAHLIAVHNHILHEDFKPLKPRQHESFCGACGSPRKPEYTKTIKIGQKGKARASQSLSKETQRSIQGGAIVYKCLRCHKRTVLQQQNAKPQKLHSTPPTQEASTLTKSSTEKSSSQPVSETPAVPTVPKSTSENASSKKRAKARKQAGLQALVASKQRSQAANSASSSLDLFDFLQQ